MNPATMMTEAELAELRPDDDAGYGVLETPKGVLPLTKLTVDARVVGLVATTEVAQTFENTLAEPVEATYVFPLPARAATTRFRMEVADRVIEGVLDERGAARQAYDEAIATGHRAAITEEDRPGVFSLRVGNLMPGEVATVRLTLTGPLPVDAGEVTYRFPLVVAPRYIPGKALPGPQAGLGTRPDTDAVPDASRITPPVLLPGMDNPVRLALRLTLDPAGLPLAEVRSSLHAVTGRGGGDGGPVVLEVRPGERLDRDFIVRWRLGGEGVTTGLVWAPDAEGQGASFLLTLVPPEGLSPERPRDVVFVLDHSGSMQGWKMVCARRAVARMVDTLGSADRFALLAFDHTVTIPNTLPSGLVAATDRNRFRGVEFLAKLDADGGTEMEKPLGDAADLLAGVEGERQRVLVLVTDGQVGNEDQILRSLAPRLGGTRVFTLGIDQAVNAGFLQRLAAAGGGACELCETEDRLDEVMDRVHRRIATPVRTDLSVRGDGLKVALESLSPRRLPDLFAGAPVLISGRLKKAPAGKGALVVRGRTPAGRDWEVRVAAPPAPAEATDAVNAAWARARIRDLEDRYAIASAAYEHDDTEALSREIVDTSKRYGVLSRFTAFVAIDKNEVVNPGGGQRQVIQPVELPAGWEDGLVGGAMPPASFNVQEACEARPMATRAVARKRALRMPSPALPPPGPAGFSGGGGAVPPEAPDALDEVPNALDEVPVTELAWPAYAARLRDLADALDAAHAAGDLEAVERLLGRLDELVADLRSVKLEASAVEALARTLRQAQDAGRGIAAATSAAAALRQLAAKEPPPARRPGRRWAFWK